MIKSHIIIVTHNIVRMVQSSKANHFQCFVIVVVCGSSPEMTIWFFFLKSSWKSYFADWLQFKANFVGYKINLKAQFLIVKIYHRIDR